MASSYGYRRDENKSNIKGKPKEKLNFGFKKDLKYKKEDFSSKRQNKDKDEERGLKEIETGRSSRYYLVSEGAGKDIHRSFLAKIELGQTIDKAYEEYREELLRVQKRLIEGNLNAKFRSALSEFTVGGFFAPTDEAVDESKAEARAKFQVETSTLRDNLVEGDDERDKFERDEDTQDAFDLLDRLLKKGSEGDRGGGGFFSGGGGDGGDAFGGAAAGGLYG